MTKLRLDLSYDGTDFHGFARQNGLRTVQGELEKVLSRLTGQTIQVFGSGRTDKGVHAKAQVVHWQQNRGPTPERYAYVLRRVLPMDIVPIDVEEVEETFHARFSALGKTYRYTIQTASTPDVFTKRYSWHQPRPLDWAAIEACLPLFKGEHDFTSFCAAGTPVENKIRRIYGFYTQRRETYVDFYVTGSGFLQNMVRIIIGTLIDVGLHQLAPTDVERALAAKNRKQAGQTAPPEGLALWTVHYTEKSLDLYRNFA